MRSRRKIYILLGTIALILFALIIRNNWPTKNDAGSAVLSWNASPDAEGYKIYYGKNTRTGDCPNGGYEKSIDAGQGTQYTVSGLKEGEEYFFSITSYNQSGQESCFGEEVNKKIDSWFIAKMKRLLKF